MDVARRFSSGKRSGEGMRRRSLLNDLVPNMRYLSNQPALPEPGGPGTGAEPFYQGAVGENGFHLGGTHELLVFKLTQCCRLDKGGKGAVIFPGTPLKKVKHPFGDLQCYCPAHRIPPASCWPALLITILVYGIIG